MIKAEIKTQELIINLKSDLKPISNKLPFDYKQIQYENQHPKFLKIGNLLGTSNNNFPALIPLQKIVGIAFKLNESNREEIHLAIQDYILQIIEKSANRHVEVSVVDTIKMGANFNLLRNLNKEILTDFIANEENVKDFIEKQYEKSIAVISECLSNYASIYDYNKNSGNIQPFRIIAIADFPNIQNIGKLNSLVRNAKEAGIFFFLSYNIKNASNLPRKDQSSFYEILKRFYLLEEYGNPANDLYGKSVDLTNDIFNDYNMNDKKVLDLIYSNKISEIIKQEIKNNEFKKIDKTTIISRTLKKIDQVINKYAIIHREYKLQLDRKSISKDKILTRLSNFSNNIIFEIEDYTKGIKIPIGKSGGKTFYFTIGFNTDNYHAIIGGQSGKGKTVLLNNIIARGIEKYDKNELKFAIIDCSGTGFYDFENSESIEFITRSTDVNICFESVKKLEEELKYREELFRENEVVDLEQYIKKTGTSLNRLIILIDEFHVLYTGNYKQVAYFDEILINKIIRIGRKFGIHLIVSTQSLGGGVRRSILDNIPLRIALGMTKDQSNNFLGFRNDAAANLDRGIAIYNDKNGSISANKQVKINLIESSDIKQIISLKQ